MRGEFEVVIVAMLQELNGGCIWFNQIIFTKCAFCLLQRTNTWHNPDGCIICNLAVDI